MRVPFQISSLSKALLGMFHIPNNQRQRAKVIVMCYGLNGNRVEQHRMCVKFGEICEKNEVNLVRFDYTDAGISEGDFSNSGLSNRVRNVLDVVEYVKGCFNGNIDIYLVGFSDGAKVAANSFLQLEDCRGLILWNPIINVGSDKTRNNDKENRKLKLDKMTKEAYKPLFGLKLNMHIIRELMNDQSKELLKSQCKKLFIFGENDVFTSEIKTYFFINKEEYPNSKFIEIKGSGHLFSDKKYEEEVINKTIEFVKE